MQMPSPEMRQQIKRAIARHTQPAEQRDQALAEAAARRDRKNAKRRLTNKK